MPTLDTYRKQAKLLMRWHRDHDYSIGGRVRTLDRFRSLTDREILAMKFPLTLAQEIVAVEAGHRSWAELKVVAANALKTPVAPTEPPVFKSVVPIAFRAGCDCQRGLFSGTSWASWRISCMVHHHSMGRCRVTVFGSICGSSMSPILRPLQ